MALPNIFDSTVSDQMIQRINKLSQTTVPKWGKMNVAQMLAHCNVTYEMAFENKHPKPNFLVAFILKSFVKKLLLARYLIRKVPKQLQHLSLKKVGILK